MKPVSKTCLPIAMILSCAITSLSSCAVAPHSVSPEQGTKVPSGDWELSEIKCSNGKVSNSGKSLTDEVEQGILKIQYSFSEGHRLQQVVQHFNPYCEYKYNLELTSLGSGSLYVIKDKSVDHGDCPETKVRPDREVSIRSDGKEMSLRFSEKSSSEIGFCEADGQLTYALVPKTEALGSSSSSWKQSQESVLPMQRILYRHDPVLASEDDHSTYNVETTCCKQSDRCQTKISLKNEVGDLASAFMGSNLEKCPDAKKDAKKSDDDLESPFHADIQTSSVRLNNGKFGLLLKVIKCGEGGDCQSSYYVYAQAGKKLEQLWKYEQHMPSVESQNQIEITRDPNKKADELYFRNLFFPSERYEFILKSPPESWVFASVPDEIRYWKLKWDPAKQSLTETKPKLFVFIVDSNKDFQEASRAKLRYLKTCETMRKFIVASTENFTDLQKGQFVIAFASPKRSETEKVVKAMAAWCPSIPGYVKEAAQK